MAQTIELNAYPNPAVTMRDMLVKIRSGAAFLVLSAADNGVEVTTTATDAEDIRNLGELLTVIGQELATNTPEEG